tara:strand:- start:690 stop:1637 length:948 start_codon:yes stop_codon:yes gene_type:complete
VAVELPNPLILQLDSKVSMELRLIPPGRFRMGSRNGFSSEQPVHWVEITRPFYMGKYPVLQSQWRALVDSLKECDLPPTLSRFEGDCHPVDQVGWNEVTRWCNLLSGNALLSRLFDKVGNVVKLKDVWLGLPSEAEWEYACRAGTETDYHSGDGYAALLTAGWFSENSGNTTHPVGEKLANNLGLYDMHGNVEEWCLDAWDKSAYRKRVNCVQDPVVKPTDLGYRDENVSRVLRGGSWFDFADRCHAAYRNGGRPSISLGFTGFRACLFLSPHHDEPVSKDLVRQQTETPLLGTGKDEEEVNLSKSHFPSWEQGD